jgi:ubiquinone/menaquinone biosynthesis C-methylase UbiE
MRILESGPRRYDWGVRLLSRGHIDTVYKRVGELARGPRILDLGCGTGTVALRLAARGQEVTGLDLSPEMLDLARQKTPPEVRVRWVQAGAVELVDCFPPAAFDTIVSVLMFSELSTAEQVETLRQCHRLLAPGGQLLIADEVRASTFPRRVLQTLVRVPLAALTYALTQTSTRAAAGLEEALAAAHFSIRRRESNRLGDFALLEAARQEVSDAAGA